MVQFLYLAFNDALRRKAQRGEPVPRWLATAVGIPWVSVLSSLAALTGLAIWATKSESARRSTHDVIHGFGLSLQREPWPLWAPLPVSCALLPLLAALLLAARARERIQRRVAAGGLPFCDACLSDSGSESDSYTPSTRRGMNPRAYFTAAGAAAAAAWLVQAWLVSLLVCVGVWGATMQSVHSAAKAVKPYSSTLVTSAAAAAAAERLTRGVSVSLSGSNSISHGSGKNGGEGWGLGGWGPGGFCPPSCVDLSSFSYYLGEETCCCNTIGGVFAAEPHAAAAAGSLTWALLGLGLLWAAVSWLLLAAGCQIAHSESEALLCSETTCGAAAEAAPQTSEPTGQGQAAVQQLSSWLPRRMGGGGVGGGWADAGEGAGQGGSRDPLLGGGVP